MTSMARRRAKSKRRRSPRSFSLINAFESYIYADILFRGATGQGPIGFLTGKQDISSYPFNTSLMVSEDPQISLTDLISEPGLAFSTMQNNLMSAAKLQQMVISTALTSIAFRVGKRALRRPIANVNRTLFKPLLGAGVKL